MSQWKAIRYSDDTYGVCRRTGNGSIEYDSARFAASVDATMRADALNGKPSLPRRLEDADFQKLTGHVRLSPSIRSALRDIMVAGLTWKAAAQTYSVTESGILRAMRRVASLNSH